ncbi:MAG: SxtJ family membrane protein [Planctomycetota bacterium]|jgi:hypothetical protein
MFEIDRNPARRQLFWFGPGLAAVLSVLGLILWARFGIDVARVVWIAAAALAVAWLVLPPLRRPFYIGWMYLTFPIAWTISHLLLAIVYYLVLTPLGLLRRLIGGDPMHRRLDDGTASYWVPHRPANNVKRYFRQY